MSICPHCGEEVTKKERKKSMFIPHVTGSFEDVIINIWHIECWQRNLIGGLNHLKKLCYCNGGTLPPDPPDMTIREAAKAAVAFWELSHERQA